MEFQNLALTPTEPAEAGLSLQSNNTLRLSPEVTENRAAKADFALQEMSPGFDSLKNSFAIGQEPVIRQNVAQQIDAKEQARRVEMIGQIAARKGGPLTDEEVARIQELSTPTMTNPDTVFEKLYGEKFIAFGATRSPEKDTVFSSAFEKNPEHMPVLLNAGAQYIAKGQTVQKLIEEFHNRAENESTMSKIGTFMEGLVPYRSWWSLHNIIKTAPGGSFFPGNNMSDQAQFAWLLPLGKMEPTIRAAAEELYQRNPDDALTFLHAIHTYGMDQAVVSNLFGVADIVGTLPVGTIMKGFRLGSKLARGADKAAQEAIQVAAGERPALTTTIEINGKKFTPTLELSNAQKAVTDIVRASAEGKVDPQPVLARIGAVDQAAVQGGKDLLRNVVDKVDPEKELQVVLNNTPAIANPVPFWENVKSLSAEAATRLANGALTQSSTLLKSLMSTNVTRLTEPELAAALKEAELRGRDMFNKVPDAVIGVRHNPSADAKNLANVDSVTLTIGKADGVPFDSFGSAYNTVTHIFKVPVYKGEVKLVGNKWVVEKKIPINETSDTVRAVTLPTEATVPRGIANQFLGWLRSAEDLLSPFSREQRHKATHAPQEMKRIVKDMLHDVGHLRNDEYNSVQRLMAASADYIHPVTGERGRFFTSGGEAEKAYWHLYQRAPSERELKAIDTYQRLSDFDWVMRELRMYRDKSRLGVVNYRYAIKNSGKTDWFHAVPVKDFDPLNAQNATIHFSDASSGERFTTTKFDLKKDNEKALILKHALDGNEFKAIQVYSPRTHPVPEVTQPVHFIVTNKLETKRLGFGEGSAYRPGGHIIYQHPWYVKQPILATGVGGRLTHFGDTSIRNFATEAQAKHWAQQYDIGRQLLKNGDEAGLKAHVEKNMPETLQEFKKLFTEGGAALSKEHPIVHTYTGRDTFQASPNLIKSYPELKDSFSAYNLEHTLNKDFLAERSQQLKTISAGVNDEGNPVYRLVDARLVDPFNSLQRGLGNAIRSRWFDDYKIMAAENWIKQFHPLMDTNHPIDRLNKNPIYYLYHPPFDSGKFLPNAPEFMAAQASRKSILNFVGAQSELATNVAFLEQQVMNSIYKGLGERAADWAGTHALPFIKDPTTFLRSIAFHAKLGFFNPVQLLVQSQSLTHILALAPQHAFQSYGAAILARTLHLTENEAIIDKYANIASKFGWKAEDFKEAYAGLRSSGLYNVAGETAWRDNMRDYKLYRGVAGSFLDKGTMFFTEGERMVRNSAWFASYREWRFANPTAELNNRSMGVIMNRADTLSVNMTRASNAAFQKGALSIPSQFWTFNMRLAEQFAGNRLTPNEKLRALFTYSAMYGIPLTVSSATAFIPFYEDIRKEAMMKGVDINDKWYQMATEGLVSAAFTWATGKEYNVSQRFGPGANTLLADVLSGEKPATDLIFGASGQTIKGIAQSTLPFVRYLRDTVSGTPDPFPVLLEDMQDTLGVISTLSNGAQMLYGLNTGMAMSKNEMYLGDVTKFDSFLLGLGIKPQEITNAQLAAMGLKERDELVKKTSQEMVKEMRRAFRALDNKDENLFNKHMTRVKSLALGSQLNWEEETKIFQQSIKGYESLVDRVNQRMIFHGDAEFQTERMKRFLEQNKAQ